MSAQKKPQSVKRKQNKQQNKQQQNQNGRIKPTRRNRIPRIDKPRFRLSPCADLYLRALVNPFAIKINGELPCVPDTYDLPSKKFGFTTRGLITLGSNGQGFVCASPFSISPGSSDCYATATINPSASYTTMTPGNSPPDYSRLYIENSPMPANVNFRPVALGLRVRYIGTELNRGGRVIPFSGSNSLINSTVELAASMGTTLVHPCDRKWHGTYWRPSGPSDSSYKTANTRVDNEARVAVWVTGAAGTQAFEFEITSYYECVALPPLQVFPDTTRSHSDPTGFGMIRDFIGQASTSDVGVGVYNAALSYMSKAVSSYGTTVITGAMPMLLTL